MTGRLGRGVDALDRSDLALQLTLVALLLRPVGGPWSRPVMLLLCAAALLFEPLRRRPTLWLGLLALATWRVASDWPVGDNHGYLLCYWLLAAWIGAQSGDRDPVLAWNGRMLVGLAFAFATLWKIVLSPDFLDGRFFLVTLVDDRRFEDLTLLATGMSWDELAALRDLLREHADGIRPPLASDPVPPDRLVGLARGLTFATVALEASIAIAFLAPRGTWISRVRDALLLAFCATTYAVATVAGFGWLLLSMGVAQCEPERRRTRAAYLAVFALVLLVSRWPWLRAFADHATG
jgi:hypothetical protein